MVTQSAKLAAASSLDVTLEDEKTKGDKRERVVILGSGWGGYTLSRRLSPKQYHTTVISPRSYFVFTPLLTDAASGSLEFSNIVEPVRDKSAQVDFIQAAAQSLDLKKKTVSCEATVVKSGVTESARTSDQEDKDSKEPSEKPGKGLRSWEQGELIEVPYDKLIIAVGAVSQTFGTPGVQENALFFKDVGDAKRVKRRLRECFELAVLPSTTPEVRKWLLHFAIVGGGPTGSELAANLRDFINEDLSKVYPSLQGIPQISLYDVAPKVLSMFDESLARYAMDTMKKEGINVQTSHHIKGLRWGAPRAPPPHHMDPKRCLTLITEEEGEIGVGMCVWATGNAMPKFIRKSLGQVDDLPQDIAVLKTNEESPSNSGEQTTTWEFKKVPKKDALMVDGHLRVQLVNEHGETAVLKNVFALGDNAMPETGAPPATAQATFQESKWLADRLNKGDIEHIPPFSFRNMGTLAYIGSEKALMQFPHDMHDPSKRSKYLPGGIKGYVARIVWNAAYITMSISWRNRLRILFRWTLNKLFGRDVARF
ncbi:hypothetical protein N7539_002548 [Penicillium diatomitis]|uniref:FAD/NAD(P)-binding domain-containing protein n=1 Tax=Penicillium diatomitis TaxID=2819901 RepID=A0A9W9XF56_9EURO|nr:uncharacterized protein N7539_002548 [Penicillium diatomitis]KAJ5490981.1 hypothetical protein N7539_002548 [Penicillium diatomitis]